MFPCNCRKKINVLEKKIDQYTLGFTLKIHLFKFKNAKKLSTYCVSRSPLEIFVSIAIFKELPTFKKQ